MNAFNRHRQQNFVVSNQLFVDESKLCWYGLDGSWIGVGCPYIVTLERKPESGMEIQNVACARLGIMLGLKLVKLADLSHLYINDADALSTETNGARVLRELCQPWADFERNVCRDSYFASISVAEMENWLTVHGSYQTRIQMLSIEPLQQRIFV